MTQEYQLDKSVRAKYKSEYIDKNVNAQQFTSTNYEVHGLTVKNISDTGTTRKGVYENFDGTRKYNYGDKYIIYKDYFELNGQKYDLRINLLEL